MPFSQEEKGINSLLSPLGREVGSEGMEHRASPGMRKDQSPVRSEAEA